MQTLHVLWFSHRDVRHPLAGGAERTIHEVGSRLAKWGDEVTLVCGGHRTLPHEDTIGGVSVKRYGRQILPHLIVPVALSELRPDVVIDDLAHVVPWASSRLSTVPGLAFFRHLHKQTLGRTIPPLAADFLSWIESRYGELYRAWPFIVESNSSRTDLLSLGVPPQRIVTIPPGVDLDVFRRGRRSPDPQVVYFSGLKPQKRPDHAVRAVRRLIDFDPRIRLVVIGDGPELGNLVRLVNELGMCDHVRFTGRLTTEAVARIVGESWVNVVTSLREGWSYTVSEAAACGVPTVGYRVPGLVDSVRPGAGLLVPDAGVDALAHALREVLGSLEEFSEGCLSSVHGQTWDQCALNWRTAIRSVLSRSHLISPGTSTATIAAT